MPRRAPKEPADPLTSTITIGPDGRLYLQEVTSDLLDVASVICSTDGEFQSRLARAKGDAPQNHERDNDHEHSENHQEAASSHGA